MTNVTSFSFFDYEGAMPDSLLSVAGGSMGITEVFD